MLNLTARSRAKLLVISPLALALGACSATAGPNSVSDASLPAADFDYVGWDQYLGGPESSQYSALTQITPGNVKNLQVAWEYPAGEGAAPQFNPIVVDGTMYVQTGDGQIAALDPATGQQKWKSETTGRISTRGINYWQSADGSDRRLVFLKAPTAPTGGWCSSTTAWCARSTPGPANTSRTSALTCAMRCPPDRSCPSGR
jgi:glucose dehydrogenase